MPFSDSKLTLTKRIGDITIHGIVTGYVRVKKAHFESSFRSGLSIFDKRWTNWLPILCWVIEHPDKTILVDAGMHPDMQNSAYYNDGSINGWVNGRIVRLLGIKDFTFHNALAAVGHSQASIDEVVITHLHLDHVGNLDLFLNKPIRLAKSEKKESVGVMGKSIPKGIKWTYSKWAKSDEIPQFGSQVLTEDGKIVLIHTPGHSVGHQSVLIQTNEGSILLAGDVTFNQEQFVDEEVPGISQKKEIAKETIRSLKILAVKYPMVYLPSHDPQSLERLENLREVY